MTQVKRQLKVGDKIQRAKEVGNFLITDYTVEIGEILYQEPWEWRNAYYIEFKDVNGCYHFWKQNFDGGKAILQDEEKSTEVELPSKEKIQEEILDSISAWDEELDEDVDEDWDISPEDLSEWQNAGCGIDPDAPWLK